jgi:protein-disulfide isomerase
MARLRTPVSPDDHVLGPADAPVTLVEYGDYQCPYCGQAHPILEALQERLGDRMRLVFRNFPLAELHPNATHAAEAAESVAEQAGNDAFWAMHDALYEHQHALDDGHLVRYAEAAGAAGRQVMSDIASLAHEERIRADFMSGVRSGVNGSPTFYINGERFEGDWTDVEAFAAALEDAAQPTDARASSSSAPRPMGSAPRSHYGGGEARA